MTSINDDSINTFLANCDNYRFIAHRLGHIMTDYPENSLASLMAILDNQTYLDSINGIEFDIQFTADSIPIVIHDINTADISETAMAIRKTNYCDLAKIKCGYRRSDYNSNIPWQENKNFTLHTLDELLAILLDARQKISDKIIKIETKTIFLNKDAIRNFQQLLIKYKALNENILHISFFPWNLNKLRSLELSNNDSLTKTELLVDFSQERPIERIWSSAIDGISLGLKNERTEGIIEINPLAKFYANLNAAFFERRNAVSEEWLTAIINKYGYAGLYTINDLNNISELMSRVSAGFIKENAKKLVITSDNPVYLKKMAGNNRY